jgi:hypothetical protein
MTNAQNPNAEGKQVSALVLYGLGFSQQNISPQRRRGAEKKKLGEVCRLHPTRQQHQSSQSLPLCVSASRRFN